MKIISEMSDDIECLIDKAECYIKKALQYKEHQPAVAECYFRAANQRVADIGDFHNVVVNLIEIYKKEKGEVPEHMQMLYDILHRKHIEHLAAVKGMIALYKEI